MVVVGDCAAGDLAAGDLDGGDFVGDLAGIFSAMSRTGAAADRFVGVRGVDFADGGLVAAFGLDFGDAPFAVEFCMQKKTVQNSLVSLNLPNIDLEFM